ncbi:MAG: methionine adenosyltransferase [Planctomycetes bacterium]|nr:methionine adenosyltransferase [Planctomycetota bacterium]
MQIITDKLVGLPIERSPVEIVERKGKGHPDTLCDRAAEEMSMALSRVYLEKFGRIQHHNVDKCVLVGGRSEAVFGGGKVTAPIQLIMVGRAVQQAGKIKIPVQELACDTTAAWLPKAVRFLRPNKDIVVKTQIKQGSADLRAVFDGSAPMANDTSFGVGYAPLSETEGLVYTAEHFLNSAEMKKKHPEVGEDIKVMGVRMKDAIRLTVAIAFVSRFVKSKEQYSEQRDDIAKLLHGLAKRITKRPVTIVVNSADKPERGSFYLTVTGTSAECGDDGQVGRGNRANGLITPYRPMTLEATAGKNPVTHTGKLYNIVAQRIADRLTASKDISEVHCYLVSQIGRPITEPQVLNVKARSRLSTAALRDRCGKVAAEALQELPFLWKQLMAGKIQLF